MVKKKCNTGSDGLVWSESNQAAIPVNAKVVQVRLRFNLQGNLQGPRRIRPAAQLGIGRSRQCQLCVPIFYYRLKFCFPHYLIIKTI